MDLRILAGCSVTKKDLPRYVCRMGGSRKLWFRRGSFRQVFVNQKLGPAFWGEYAALVKAYDAPRPRLVGYSFEALFDSYQRSERFASLKLRTQRDYAKQLAFLEARIGDRDVRKMQRKHVVAMREAGLPAYRFNYCLRVLRVALEHAIDQGLRTDNPAKGVREIRSKGREREPWPPELIAAFRAEAPPRTRLLFELLLGTGQRIGDVLRMQWGHVEGDGINVVQGKTSARLWIPFTATLRAALEAAPRDGLFILTSRRGAWSYRGAADAMMTVRRKIGAEAYDIHSLRFTAAAELAALGVSDEDIAAVTGHRSRAMVVKYTGAARQRARATKAQEKRR